MSDPTTITAIVADPHPSTRTLAAVAAVMEGSRSLGAVTSIIETDDGVATPEILAAIESSHGVILASPTYRADATWVLKRLLDELPRTAGAQPESVLRAKAVQILLTGTSPHHFLGGRGVSAIAADFFGAQLLSPALYFTHEHFDEQRALITEAANRAHAHGRSLVELAALCRGGAFDDLFPLI